MHIKFENRDEMNVFMHIGVGRILSLFFLNGIAGLKRGCRMLLSMNE